MTRPTALLPVPCSLFPAPYSLLPTPGLLEQPGRRFLDERGHELGLSFKLEAPFDGALHAALAPVLVVREVINEGAAGLLPKRPGPRGPSKLTEDVLSFVKQRLQTDASISTLTLLAQVQEKFRVSFHRRTLEKLLRDLRSKKT